MSLEWVALIGIAIVVVLLVIFRKTKFVRKNWKYFLILAPLVVMIILRIMSGIKKKDDTKTSSGNDQASDDLDKDIEKLKDKLEEVQMETAIEVSAAKTKNEEVLKKLEEIKKIEDTSERRKRLAAMIG
jgi:glucan phosphoethanolaminetransferase (alkaline phosphatase superfamily)